MEDPGSQASIPLGLSESDHEAIGYFEQAMEKETHGLMSDAVAFYRKAFKINDQVDLLYRHEKVPHNINKLKQEAGKNTAVRVDEKAVKSINVDELLQSFEHVEASAPDPNNPEHVDLTIKFSNLGTDNHEEVADIKPVSPLIHLPNDIWSQILEILLITSGESWFNFSITCKKNAYLGLAQSNVWRKLCYLIYPNQNYYENKVYIDSNQTPGNPTIDLPVPLDQLQILPQYNNLWKYMLHNRPFIKFHGCYISVVNYYSEGGKAENSLSWSNPVRTITYYRYIRFYPDGTCVKVLSSLEPDKVVPKLLKYNSQKSVGTILQEHPLVPKEGHRIYHGRWTLSLSDEVHVVIENGSVPYYTFHYHFEIKPLAGIYKHNKLKWIKYYAIRKKINDDDDDDRIGEETVFTLRNETAFKYLKVRSYNLDN